MAMHRLVPAVYAKTAADAEAYVTDDTGGQVIPVAGKTQAVTNGWMVECYSTDGQAAMPLHVAQNLEKLSNEEGLRERPGMQSVGPNPSPDRLAKMKSNAAELQRVLKEPSIEEIKAKLSEEAKLLHRSYFPMVVPHQLLRRLPRHRCLGNSRLQFCLPGQPGFGIQLSRDE